MSFITPNRNCSSLLIHPFSINQRNRRIAVWASSAQSRINDVLFRLPQVSLSFVPTQTRFYPTLRRIFWASTRCSIIEAPKTNTIAPYIESKIQRLNTLRQLLNSTNKPSAFHFEYFNARALYLTEELAELLKWLLWKCQRFLRNSQRACQSLFMETGKNKMCWHSTNACRAIPSKTRCKNHIPIWRKWRIAGKLSGAHDDAATVVICMFSTMTDKAMYHVEHLLSELLIHAGSKTIHEVIGYLPHFNTPGLTLYIQSPTTNAHVLYEETMGFLSHMPGLIANLPKKCGAKHKHLSCAKILRRSEFSMKCQRLWTAMTLTINALTSVRK